MRKVILLMLAGVLFAAGCNQADSQKFTAALAETRTSLADSKKQIADLQQAANALPAGDAKAKALDVLAKAEAARAALESKAVAIEAINVAAKTGATDSIGGDVAGLLNGVPVVGPYAGVIGAVAGIAFGIWQRSRRKADVDLLAAELQTETGHLTNVVKSIEVAGPDPTESDKAAIRAVQGAETSLRVDQIKAGV